MGSLTLLANCFHAVVMGLLKYLLFKGQFIKDVSARRGGVGSKGDIQGDSQFLRQVMHPFSQLYVDGS